MVMQIANGYIFTELIKFATMKKTNVRIDKVQSRAGKWYYNIRDIDTDEFIDGFPKKWMAIDAIKRWGLNRVTKEVKVYYF